jgi:hypothetical protein
MDVAAFDFEIALKDVFILKRQHGFITAREKNMISQQVQKGQKKCGDQVRSEEAGITHSGIEHRHHFRIAGQTGGEKDDRDQRKNRTEQTIYPGNKIEIVIHQDLFPGDRLLHKFFNMLTKIDGDADDRKQHGGEKEGAQVFEDDISVQCEQGYT